MRVLPTSCTAFAGAATVAISATYPVQAFFVPSSGVSPTLHYSVNRAQTFSVSASSSLNVKSCSTEMMLRSSQEPRPPRRQLLPATVLANGARRILDIGKQRRRMSICRRSVRRDDDEYDVDGGDDEEEEDYEDDEEDTYDDTLDRNIMKRLKRTAVIFRQVSWVSWWAQTILSTVAFIILLFSNAVTNRSARGNIFGNGVALALASLFTSGASICWTWGYTLKARGWPRLGTLVEVDDAQLRMRNSLKMGVYINVIGMLLALIGAEQIVGTLVAKVLYSQGFQPSVMVGSAGMAEAAQAQFRALDVFIVQANTNTVLSHFCSLAASLWLLSRTPKLAKLAKGVY